ncbi:MAG: GntR family transcriptional regulator [Beijerinckiaceae bacterium]|jgi:GntR family transcriptional regulator|nr:GntR family transcriptional regulator [Beijerinckiaceae bacterium]
MAIEPPLRQSPALLPPLDGDPHLPLYRRLYLAFAQQIARGAWRPGDSLPAETRIAELYRIAPGTVRKAIDELADRRLVDRRHGQGTFIARPNFDNAMLRFFRFRDDRGAPVLPESRILHRAVIRLPAALAQRWSIPEAEMIHLARERSWEGQVRLIEDIYLPAVPFAALLEADESAIGPLLYPAYERLCGQVVYGIEEDIVIRDAAGPDRARLGLGPGTLAVEIARIARNAVGEPLEWRLSRAEARRFRYHLALGMEGSDGARPHVPASMKA